MKRSHPYLASLLALALSSFSTLSVAAADSAPALPVISITQIDAGDAAIYAAQIAAINAVMKEKFGIDPFLRLYHGFAAGPDTGAVFAVSRGESFASLIKDAQAYQTDPALADLRGGLNAVREVGPRTLLKAARFDGAHPGAWLYNTYANVTDEAGYLAAIGALRALFDKHGLTDAKLNVYRVIAGRSDFTHLVSINSPSAERHAAVLDAISSEPWAAEWLAGSARLRTVVRNGTFNEISR